MDGIINIYKEAGFTSFDVVAKLRGILKQKKIGHTGTLDPDAEGVLPVCIGKATKLCDYLTGKDKVYRAVLRLGITTDTQDMSGTVLTRQDPAVSEEEILAVIQGFTGRQTQIPPMYSALKVNGIKLCDLARAGIEVERRPREIEIFSIKVHSVELPRVTMEIHCSKGTYIRTLCQDIGSLAGCGGCMEKLLRTETAGFSVENAYRLKEVEEIVKGADQKGRRIEDILLPVEAALKDYPRIDAKPGMEKILRNGGRFLKEDISLKEESENSLYRVYDASGMFVGLFRYDPAVKMWKPEKMFLESSHK